MTADLKRLLNSLPVKPQLAPLKWVTPIRDLLRSSALEGAGRGYLRLIDEQGSRTIDVELTEELYKELSPLLDEEEKAILAWGVLEGIVGPTCWQDWDAAKKLLRKTLGTETLTDGAWLPALVDTEVFAAIGAALKSDLADHRSRNPLPPLEWTLDDKPRWDGKTLSFRGQTWVFRRDNGPVNQLLDEFQSLGWRDFVRLPVLTRRQVSEAARYLRNKTKGVVNWHSSKRGELRWSTKNKG